MVRIPPFAVEQWMDEYETTPGVLNVAETCAASVSVDELSQLAIDSHSARPIDFSTKLTYGTIRGSHVLRERIAKLHGPDFVASDVFVTQGAIAANFQVIFSVISAGDHVICVHPTYQQLYSVPAAIGAEVTLWRLKEAEGFVLDIGELATMIKPNTKMIIINNPNNPTGVRIPHSTLSAIVELAEAKDIYILSDEVYRPLYHDYFDRDADIPPSIVTLGYGRTIATGSMSKAYAMAGIRIGWIVTKDESIIERIATTRDYTTISVSQIDDQIAAYALSDEVRVPLLKRNVALAKTNLALLEQFILKHAEICSWTKPTAGTTALVKFSFGGMPVDDVLFCLNLLAKTKVMFVPASRCFGEGQTFIGYVRIGYVCHTEVLVAALQKLDKYLGKRAAGSAQHGAGI